MEEQESNFPEGEVETEIEDDSDLSSDEESQGAESANNNATISEDFTVEIENDQLVIQPVCDKKRLSKTQQQLLRNEKKEELLDELLDECKNVWRT